MTRGLINPTCAFHATKSLTAKYICNIVQTKVCLNTIEGGLHFAAGIEAINVELSFMIKSLKINSLPSHCIQKSKKKNSTSRYV